MIRRPSVLALLGGCMVALATLALTSSTPLDDFNRANTGPPLSAQWTTQILSGTCGLKVVGNVAVSDVAGACSGWWNAEAFGADMEASVQWSDATAASGNARLYVRLAQPGVAGQTDGYVCQAEPVTGPLMYLRRVDNSVLTGVLAQAGSGTWATGDTMGCTIIGTQWCGWRKAAGTDVWTSLVCFTDATYAAGGFAGLGIGVVDLSVDNFWAGTPRRARHLIGFN